MRQHALGNVIFKDKLMRKCGGRMARNEGGKPVGRKAMDFF